MRPIFRWLFKVNKKYDNMKEPWRMIIFVSPIMVIGIVSGSISFIYDGALIKLLGTMMMPLGMAIMATFRMPVFFMNKGWVNTYIIGWPYKFKHEVQVNYVLSYGREEITESESVLKQYRYS